MTDPRAPDARMKTVILEPALQERAALWTSDRKLKMALVFERWAHQLRVSVKVIASSPEFQQRPKSLRHLPRRKATLN